MDYTYTDIKNPVYASADKSIIDCQVKFAAWPSYVPFAASASDPESHGQQIYADLVAGKWGAIAPYVPPSPTSLTPAQQYAAAIAKGIAVVSASTPELNGTYGVTPADQQNISVEAQFINTWQEFTNGQQVFDWADAKGRVHAFPSTAIFMAFAKGAAQYVSACKQALIALQAGDAASFPSNAVSLP